MVAGNLHSLSSNKARNKSTGGLTNKFNAIRCKIWVQVL